MLPSYNEAKILEKTVKLVTEYINQQNFEGVNIRLLITDNGSTDSTPEVSKKICENNSLIFYLRVDAKGKGFALQEAWSIKGYNVYFFMDADLAYDLSVIPELIDAFKRGEKIVVASRFATGSLVKRHWFRKFLSRGYRLLLKILFRNKFNDAQAGCKAISAEVRNEILPYIKNGGWFFDTKLLIMAERHGYQVKELSIICIDPRPWRMKIISTVIYFLFNSIWLRITLCFH